MNVLHRHNCNHISRRFWPKKQITILKDLEHNTSVKIPKSLLKKLSGKKGRIKECLYTPVPGCYMYKIDIDGGQHYWPSYAFEEAPCAHIDPELRASLCKRNTSQSVLQTYARKPSSFAWQFGKSRISGGEISHVWIDELATADWNRMYRDIPRRRG